MWILLNSAFSAFQVGSWNPKTWTIVKSVETCSLVLTKVSWQTNLGPAAIDFHFQLQRERYALGARKRSTRASWILFELLRLYCFVAFCIGMQGKRSFALQTQAVPMTGDLHVLQLEEALHDELVSSRTSWHHGTPQAPSHLLKSYQGIKLAIKMQH